MFKGLATSLSSAVSSLDQAAREVVSISLEDAEDDEEGEYGEYEEEEDGEESDEDATAVALKQAAGALWNRSSGVIASVTSEVASAMTEEIGGVSAAVRSVVSSQSHPSVDVGSENEGRQVDEKATKEQGATAANTTRDAASRSISNSRYQDASHSTSDVGALHNPAMATQGNSENVAMPQDAHQGLGNDADRVCIGTTGRAVSEETSHNFEKDEAEAQQSGGSDPPLGGVIRPANLRGGGSMNGNVGTRLTASGNKGQNGSIESEGMRETMLKEEKAQLIEDLNAAVHRCATLQEANAGLVEMVDSLTREEQRAVTSLSDQLQGLKEECSKLREKATVSEQEKAVLQQTCMELQQRLQPTVTELQVQSSTLTEMKANMVAVDLENEQLKKRIKGLEQLVRQASEEAELVRFRQEQTKTEERLATRPAALDAGGGECAALLQLGEDETSGKNDWEHQCGQLTMQLAEAKKELGKRRDAEEHERGEVRLLYESVTALTQIVGVSPEGSRSNRLKDVCTKVQEVVSHSRHLVQRVAQLEAWRAEHLEETESLQEHVKRLEGKGGVGAGEDVNGLRGEVEELRKILQQGVAARRVAESECKAMRDENEGLRSLIRETHASREEEIATAVEEAQRGFEQEVAMLRGALDKLKVRVAETSEDSAGLEEAVIGKNEELGALRSELEWEKDDRRREREEWSEAGAAREADIARIKDHCRSLQEQIDSLEGANEVLEMERDKTIEERERMEAILESFHEQDTLDSSLHLDKAKREAEAARVALSEREAQIVSLTDRLDRLATVEHEAAQLRIEADKLRSETAMSGRLTDEMSTRMDQMADQLRKARMFAASEEHYVDRRLVSNIVVSYFDGMKAGTVEVLVLLCSILGMSDEQKRLVERGHTRTNQSQGGVGRGLYGLLTAPITIPSRGWEAITEGEIGQEWVQFLIDETEASGAAEG